MTSIAHCVILFIRYITIIDEMDIIPMKGKNMAVSYNGLWKMLIDKNMYKKDLSAELNISSATMAKMGKGENVSMDVLQKICEYMDCNIGDVMSFEKEEKGERGE